MAELTVTGRGLTYDYSLKKKDWKSNQWASPVTSVGTDVDNQKEFRLWGSIQQLPSQLSEIERIDWSWKKAVAWPDENSIYVNQGEMTESVNGNSHKVSCWKLKDASSPMILMPRTT